MFRERGGTTLENSYFVGNIKSGYSPINSSDVRCELDTVPFGWVVRLTRRCEIISKRARIRSSDCFGCLVVLLDPSSFSWDLIRTLGLPRKLSMEEVNNQKSTFFPRRRGLRSTRGDRHLASLHVNDRIEALYFR